MASARTGAYSSSTWGSRSYSGWGTAVALALENYKGGAYASGAYGHTTYAGVSRGGAAATVSMAGLASAGAYGTPSTAYTIKPAGAATAGGLGQPNVLYNQFVSPVAVATSFAAGLYRTSVTVPLGGVTPTETFGGFTFQQAQYINPLPIDDFAAGRFSTSVTVPMAAGVSAEAFGRPPPPARVMWPPMLAAASAESFGQPIVGDFKLIGSALSAEAVGRPAQAIPGPVTVLMLGEVLTAFGRPSIAVTVFMGSAGSLQAVSNIRAVRSQTHLIGSALSSEAFGQPTIPVKPVGVVSGQALGRPVVSVALTVPMQGTATAENVPGPRYVGSVVVMQGAASTEAVSELPRTLRPTSIATGFAAGGFTFYVPPVDQTLHPQGTASVGAVGVPRVLAAIVTMQGAASTGTVAAPFVNRQLRMVGFVAGPAPSRFSVVTRVVQMWPATSSEAVGLPNFPSPQTVPLLGTASAETFGAWNWTRATMVFPIPVATGEFITGPTFAFGGVIRTMQGAASAAALSPVHTHETRTPAAADSAEAFGLPSTFSSISPRGIPSAEAVGRTERLVAGAVFKFPLTAAQGEAFGLPTVHAQITVAMAGAASAATVTDPTLDFTTVLRFLPVPSDEAVPGPGVAAHNDISPTAVQTSESFGSPSSSVEFFAELVGVDPAETFGEPTLHSTISELVGGAVSGEGFGAPRLALLTRISPASVDPDETVGAPRISRTIRLSGIPTGFAAGGWQGHPGELRVPMLGKPEYDFEPHGPADKYGEPRITTTILGGHLVGVPSAESVSRPRIPSQGLNPGGIASQEHVGATTVPNVAVHLRSIARSDDVGRFWVFWGSRLAPAGAAPTGAVGQPRIPSQTIHPRGAASAAVVAAPVTHFLFRARGAASSFDAGRPTVVQYLRPSGVVSSSAAGVPQAPAHTLHPASAAPGELVGRARTSLTVPLASANTGALLGRPTLAVTFTLRPGPATGVTSWDGPSISTVVQLRALGIEPDELAGLPTPTWLYAIGPLPIVDGELVGAIRWSQYPTTGVWIDTTVSTRTQMLAVQGRSMKLEVLAMGVGVSFEAVGTGVGSGLLLGATLPIASGMADIIPGSGVGVRYIGDQDFDPSSVEFIVDGATKPLSQLVFFHEDSNTLGAPFRSLDIYWLTPSSFPEGLHTVAVHVIDVTAREDTKVWQFTSEPPSGGPI